MPARHHARWCILITSLVATSASELAAAPVILSDERPLLALSANQQLFYGAARGDGQTLVVWGDRRAGGADHKLYAARVRDDGTVLDAEGFALAAAPGAQSNARVAWGGGMYFVVWEDRRRDRLNDVDLFAARIGADGVVLDPDGIEIAGTDAREVDARLASNGTTFVATWRVDGFGQEVRATLVGFDGGVVVAEGWPLPQTQSPPAFIGRFQDEYITVWRSRTGDAAVAARFAGEGIVLPPEGVPLIKIDPALEQQPIDTPFLTTDGRGYLLSFGVRTARLDGTLLTPALASDISKASSRVGQLIWDGKVYVASTLGERVAGEAPLIMHRVSAAGAPLADATTGLRLQTAQAPAVVGLGNGRSIVFYDRLTGEGVQRVFFRFVDSNTQEIGRSCATNDCTSGHCVDGVCCVSACGGDRRDECLVCSAAGGAPRDGVCAPRPQAAPCDDGNACTLDDTCSTDAVCRGRATACPFGDAGGARDVAEAGVADAGSGGDAPMDGGVTVDAALATLDAGEPDGSPDLAGSDVSPDAGVDQPVDLVDGGGDDAGGGADVPPDSPPAVRPPPEAGCSCRVGRAGGDGAGTGLALALLVGAAGLCVRRRRPAGARGDQGVCLAEVRCGRLLT
jgi:MYXO-CTERM domain-containing protein